MFTKEYIYLDWNVVKLIKNCQNNDFNIIVDNLKSKYIIPYSFAHLCDLQKKISKDTLDYIIDDIQFLSNLSNSNMIGIYKNDFDISKQDINIKFTEVTNYNKKIYNILSEHVLDDIYKIGFKEYFKVETNQKHFTNFMKLALDRFNSDHKAFKQIRKELSELFKEKYDIYELKNNESDYEKFRLSVKEHMIKDGLDTEDSLLTIGTAYGLLEYFTPYKEKLTKKSSFSNIYNDGDHLKYAMNAKYYITKDKSSIKKINYLSKIYNINCKVFSPEQFVKNYS